MIGNELSILMQEEEYVMSQLVAHAEFEKNLFPDDEDEEERLERNNVIGRYSTSNAFECDNFMNLSNGHIEVSELMGSQWCGVGSIPRNLMDELADHHHLTKSQVEALFMVLGPHYSNPGRRAPLKDFVLTSLVVLSTKNNYRELNESKLFKSRGWMHKTIHQFCRMLVQHLGNVIEWPSARDASDAMAEFEAIAGMPGVIGALDTCHMPITKAPVGKKSKTYANRMLFHSIHLLAVSDAKSRFTYVNVGRPGSFHECNVLHQSSLKQVMQSDPSSLFPPNSYLIADSAFPLSNYVITPYPKTQVLTQEQKVFNTKLYATRKPVDGAYELLRARWKRLKCLEMDEVSSMISLIKACCILHNICMANDGYAVVTASDLEEREDVEVEYTAIDQVSAARRRDILSDYLSGQVTFTSAKSEKAVLEVPPVSKQWFGVLV